MVEIYPGLFNTLVNFEEISKLQSYHSLANMYPLTPHSSAYYKVCAFSGLKHMRV